MDKYKDYIAQGKKIEIIIRTPSGPLRFFSTLEEINSENIVTTRPQNKHINFNYPLNQEIELYAYTDGGIYKLKCKMLTLTQKEARFTLPHSVERIQRREFIRVDIKTKINLRLHQKGSVRIIQATTRNISAKGANMLLDEDISSYSQVEASLIFAEENIKTLAQVIKAIPVKIDNRIYYDTSLMFITINEKGMNFIVKKCFEFETAQRRKKLEEQEER